MAVLSTTKGEAKRLRDAVRWVERQPNYRPRQFGRRISPVSGGGGGPAAPQVQLCRVLQVHESDPVLGAHCLVKLLVPQQPGDEPGPTIEYEDSTAPTASPPTLPANRDGQVNSVDVNSNAVTETWTLTYNSAFDVWTSVGSVSGQDVDSDTPTGGTWPYAGSYFSCFIVNGTTQPFQHGDQIIIEITAGELVAFPDPVALYAMTQGVTLGEIFLAGDNRYWLFTVGGVKVLMPGGLTADVNVAQELLLDNDNCPIGVTGITLRIVGGFIIGAA